MSWSRLWRRSKHRVRNKVIIFQKAISSHAVSSLDNDGIHLYGLYRLRDKRQCCLKDTLATGSQEHIAMFEHAFVNLCTVENSVDESWFIDFSMFFIRSTEIPEFL